MWYSKLVRQKQLWKALLLVLLSVSGHKCVLYTSLYFIIIYFHTELKPQGQSQHKYSSIYSIPGVGNLRPAGRIWPAKQNHPARSPFTNRSKFMAYLMVLHFVNLPSLQTSCIAYLWKTKFEKPHCVINVGYCTSYFGLSLWTVKIRP